MELEHRFEVPVGVEKAWTALLDMEQVGPCFPGAILDHVDGDEFSGSVKIKLGPIRMTYKGSARRSSRRTRSPTGPRSRRPAMPAAPPRRPR